MQLELPLFAETSVRPATNSAGAPIPGRFILTVKPPVMRQELTPEQAAQRIGCDASTVRRWLREGRMPFRRRGVRNKLIPAEEVERFCQPE
jgi:excisionase family DNA binding protein